MINKSKVVAYVYFFASAAAFLAAAFSAAAFLAAAFSAAILALFFCDYVPLLITF
jgi:hypothetical protein